MSRTPNAPTLFTFLNTLTTADLQQHLLTVIPTPLPSEYLDSLDEADRRVALQHIALAWHKTKKLPRVLQLKAAQASAKDHDSFIYAGTGAGKTLCSALTMWSDALNASRSLSGASNSPIYITISPLKRLQESQVKLFREDFQIPTVAINDDTPTDVDWWNDNVYSSERHTLGSAQHLVITVEQLFKNDGGHYTRLGRYIRDHSVFKRAVRRVFVDEAHNVRMAGSELYGSPAFRPAWGKLGELKNHIPKSVWQGFSATSPPHIMSAIENAFLKPNYTIIRSCLNRPNLTYATHCVVGSLSVLENYECFLTAPFDFDQQPSVLLFFDNSELAKAVADHVDSRLPPQWQGKGVAQHYHSMMSKEYCEKTHERFVNPKKAGKILCATSAEAEGIDFWRVKIVVHVGLPKNGAYAVQAGGRAERDPEFKGLYIIFYESWALDISLEAFENGKWPADPDRPREGLGQRSSLQLRACRFSIELVTSTTCIRKLFANYLNDTHPDALLHRENQWCCERCHPDFSLKSLLPSSLFVVDPDSNKRKRTPNVYRVPRERDLLAPLLAAWLEQAHQNDPLKHIRPPHFILSIPKFKTLVKAPRHAVQSPDDITILLEETKEWAKDWSEGLFQVISEFDATFMKFPKSVQFKRLRLLHPNGSVVLDKRNIL
ncbi:hypothetical protein PM082_009383 [Marasmius tenuissimus]|nr:hypothetical protein PM082_009383 [Marasmius tenuissimus]